MSLQGQTVCFSGALSITRAAATSLAQGAGATVTSSMTAATQILIVANITGSKKITDARNKGKTIWSEQDFNKALVGHAAGQSAPAPKAKAAAKKKPAPKRKAAAPAAAANVMIASSKKKAKTSPGGQKFWWYLEVPGSKFWRAMVEGANVTLTTGKIGTKGQKQLKKCADGTAAAAFLTRQVAAKRASKDWVDAIDPTQGGTVVSPAAPAAAPSAMHGRAGYGFGSSGVVRPQVGTMSHAAPTAFGGARAGFGSLSSDEDEDSGDDGDGDGDAAMAMVDARAPSQLQAGSVLQTDDGEHCDCMLNQVNIGSGQNNNKFYKLQLVETGSGQVFQFVRYGRVGEGGATQQKGPWDKDTAITSFKKQFKSKTGNSWDTRDSFVKKAGKYDLVMVTHASAVVKASTVGRQACQLDPTTQGLIDLIFDEDTFKGAMTALKIDPSRLPLGALSKAQINKGYAALNTLRAAVKRGDHAGAVAASGSFYTVIPHTSGRAALPPLITEDEVNDKVDMLNTLADIADAMAMRKHVSGGTATGAHPADEHYGELKADLDLLNAGDPDLRMIETYLAATGGGGGWGGGMQLDSVWRCDRHKESTRFNKYKNLKNRKLLWHGTNVAVVAAIIKSGLRIMPHSGGRVGAGIYLADQHTKSAGYTQAARGKNGKNSIIMFLVEAPLGAEYTLLQDDPSLRKAPHGFDSVVARGSVEPDPRGDVTMMLDGKPVTVPQSKEIQTGRSSSFHHNEFLIYNEAQHRIRFVLRFTQ